MEDNNITCRINPNYPHKIITPISSIPVNNNKEDNLSTLLGQVEIMTLDLYDFICNKMRMPHSYQPVMIKVMLENGGKATVDQIAASILP